MMKVLVGTYLFNEFVTYFMFSESFNTFCHFLGILTKQQDNKGHLLASYGGAVLSEVGKCG